MAEELDLTALSSDVKSADELSYKAFISCLVDLITSENSHKSIDKAEIEE